MTTETEMIPTVDTAIPTSPLAPLGVTLAQIDLAIKTAIEGIDPADAAVPVLPLYQWIKSLAAMSREWNQLAEQRFIDTINAQGDVQCGSTRFYVGTDKKHKARSNGAVLEAVLDSPEVAGDFEKACACLGANPWKRSQIAEFIGDDKTAELFETTEAQDLKTGAIKKGLKTYDPTFLR